jgi:hypothetical protein
MRQGSAQLCKAHGYTSPLESDLLVANVGGTLLFGSVAQTATLLLHGCVVCTRGKFFIDKTTRSDLSIDVSTGHNELFECHRFSDSRLYHIKST